MNGGVRGASSNVRDGATRGISPVVGVVVLIALTVCLATVIAVGVGAWSLEAGGPTAAFDLSVDGEQSTVAVEHVSGDPVDVGQLSVVITVNDEELADQPPVPFVGADGFVGTPNGPFNSATDQEWRAGERASVTVAEENDPGIEGGDSVTVTLTVDGDRVAILETTAS
ncbi:type IV pilin N-terminal domain-containing protein [Natronorubrum halophilum]|uniref:type IV pilin N-terminal domain-containing protein n=1 Tax=Natronorubrum halophilum TaxID=1702106 RepID=UPI001EE8327E|nr:type IV pilin N-terminal domain-containing protein [Natronorubrum halophilum]